ncbi:hypothetical protein TspCOW1_15450 [Thiohalobacter sp. COW1]|uniref:hypothetical protein n=1 Tax=Thiohalobacter sp. COW1 TaxID=2795687 RepID=UPI001916879E|nr:hypothetical protein [Thiohalobacter sp. COW1]BCO31442.1 hypothetical protein TspCOW1_15450 [Thiohalobacter sp. COW1]
MQAMLTLPEAAAAGLDRPPRRDLLEAVLLYLMTRHTLQPSPGLARGVVHHLRLLLAHPDLQHTPVDRSAYETLLRDWILLACDHRGNQLSH